MGLENYGNFAAGAGGFAEGFIKALQAKQDREDRLKDTAEDRAFKKAQLGLMARDKGLLLNENDGQYGFEEDQGLLERKSEEKQDEFKQRVALGLLDKAPTGTKPKLDPETGYPTGDYEIPQAFNDYNKTKTENDPYKSMLMEWQLKNAKAQNEKSMLDLDKSKKEQDLGKQLPPDKVLVVQEGKSIPNMINDIRETIQNNKDKYGPVSGAISSVNPYDKTAKAMDAQMRAAAQSFGRYMEGGVLRKEDEDKYRKMFPNITDTPDSAEDKLNLVDRLLKQKLNGDVEALKTSGYDVSGLGEKFEVPGVPESLGGKKGILDMVMVQDRDGKQFKIPREKLKEALSDGAVEVR